MGLLQPIAGEEHCERAGIGLKGRARGLQPRAWPWYVALIVSGSTFLMGGKFDQHKNDSSASDEHCKAYLSTDPS